MRAVASAALVCFPMVLQARPGTPLRVLCIAALEYLARLQGGTLGRKRRLTLALACDFGSLRDDYYDHERFDATEYRWLRGKLRQLAPQPATCRYIVQLRQAERSRPCLNAFTPGLADAVIGYRTGVLDLSLVWLGEIAGLSIASIRFQALRGIVGLTQLADDLLDWKEDHARGRPTFVTAVLLDRSAPAAVPLRSQADALLRRSIGGVRDDAGVVPFALAAGVVWMFVLALIRVRFPR